MKETRNISLLRKSICLSGFAVLALTLLLTSGCVAPTTTHRDSVSTSERIPLLISVLDDKTKSMRTARSTPIQERDLLEILALLRESGGELSFGVVGETTSLPLLRVRIPSPPLLPNKPADDNAFVRAEKSAEFSASTKRYETDYRQWEASVNERVNDFLAVARQRLAAPVNDRTSPVSEALTRAQLFLGEQSGWSENSRRMIVLQSDCQDTTTHKPVEIKANTTILVVNGTGSLGVLADVQPKPLQLEAMSAALEFIKTEVRR
jgi:hypothetical protein